ncbi:hypothetical protein KQX54_005899 [Cotesia glomerata]|uniref:Uncharacterized protein n=1 Tax=Cotesia glomerata TaxID=32391 RepID=A0AAV7IUM3_COTGL|nr:hypothetical protein KQX54_005899 [Cotesia glomerata]
MAKILLMFIVLTCLIATITPAVYDYACYEKGCSIIEGRCSKNEDCCDGYQCHPLDSSWQVVQKNGCYPVDPVPCSQLEKKNV